jgi:putative ABC transport system permease protein
VVVSYAYWLSQLGGVEIGSNNKLRVNGDLVEVVGVTPPGFFGLAVGETFDIAVPFCKPKSLRRDVFDTAVMGRLRPGWTLEQATAHLNSLSPGIFEATALTGYTAYSTERYKNFRLAAYPGSSGVSTLRETYDRSLWLLLGITGLVLLIACANLANLMLARSNVRQREIAVRLALGASRGRLIRQLVAESSLLAGIGAALGVGIAQIVSRTLVWSLSTQSGAVSLPIATDWRVLLFATVVAGLTCAVFGVVPAFQAANTEPVAAMKAGGRGMTAGRDRFSMQRLMVVTQIAVSMVLLVGAILFVRSFRNLMTFDAGMRQAGIAIAFAGFRDSNVPPDRVAEFRRDLLEEVRSIPGIIDAASTTNAPLLGSSWSHGLHIGGKGTWARFAWVSPGYFHTMGIPLRMGRDFNRYDTASSARVALVNETFVRNQLGGSNPIGQTLRTSPEPNYPATVYEIIGVVADAKYSSIRGETQSEVFAPDSQCPNQGPWASIMIYSNATSAATGAVVKRRIAEKHPLVIMQFTDFQGRIRDGLTRDRLMAILSGFFGLLAALLATVGLYGMISYVVTHRRNEIGVRMALGARGDQVIAMVMRESASLVVIGVTIGVVLSLVAGRAAGSLLFELKPYDAVTLIASAALMAVIAIVASFLPARRALNLDPMTALREE